jgi:hypothetical protein
MLLVHPRPMSRLTASKAIGRLPRAKRRHNCDNDQSFSKPLVALPKATASIFAQSSAGL